MVYRASCEEQISSQPLGERAMMVGYGTTDAELPPQRAEWRLVSREREALVSKRAWVRVRIQSRLEALMPGYAELSADLWRSPVALMLARDYGSARALLAAGLERIVERVRGAGHRVERRTVARVLQWAAQASSPDPQAEVRHRLLCNQLELLHHIEAQIEVYECDLADYLVDTPLVLLMGIPGINVVSAASYGAELGPLEHYVNAKKISGRAGLYPSRYQSDEMDLADGPLVGRRSARLRDAILEIAHNLISHNEHFKAWADLRRKNKWPGKKIHIAVGNKFVRISYRMLAQRAALRHPCLAGHDAILHKLLGFARDHGLTPGRVRDLLLRAARQLPEGVRTQEARALHERPSRTRRRPVRRASEGPVRLGGVLREVIEQLAPDLCISEQRSQPSRKHARKRTPR